MENRENLLKEAFKKKKCLPDENGETKNK